MDPLYLVNAIKSQAAKGLPASEKVKLETVADFNSCVDRVADKARERGMNDEQVLTEGVFRLYVMNCVVQHVLGRDHEAEILACATRWDVDKVLAGKLAKDFKSIKPNTKLETCAGICRAYINQARDLGLWS